MKKTSILILSFIALISFNSCHKVIGDGPVVTETRNHVNFTGINLSLYAELYYTESNEFKVELHAQQNILDVIETFVMNGNELRVKTRNDVNIRSHDPVIIHISAPDITSLIVRGSGNIKVTQPISPSTLRTFVNGSGNISISKMETTNITGDISGSGDIEIRDGSANHSTLNISGSGNINMLNLMTKTANATISGSGSIRLFTTEMLDARISGSGEILYKGSPAIRSVISGSGRLIRL